MGPRNRNQTIQNQVTLCAMLLRYAFSRELKMIIADGKPIQEILAMIASYQKIVLAGCKGCVTVCSAGGEKEAGILASALRLARQAEGNPIEIKEISLERQCDTEYLEPLRRDIDDYQAVLSIACGAGVQFLAEKFRKHPILPGVNTTFIGVTEEQGVWTERCQSCGNCLLDQTGRDLPDCPLLQEPLERPLRRLENRQMRDRLPSRLRLAADLRPAERSGAAG